MLKIFCSTDLLLLCFTGSEFGAGILRASCFFFSRNKHVTSAYSPSEWFYKFVLTECMLSGQIFFFWLSSDRT